MLAWIWCNHKGFQSALSVLKARDKREIVLYSEHFSGQHYYCAVTIFQDFFFFRFRGSSQPDKRTKWALSCKKKCLHFHPLLVDDICPSPYFYWTGFHGRLFSEVWLRAFLHSQKSQRLQWLRYSVTMTWMCPFEHTFHVRQCWVTCTCNTMLYHNALSDQRSEDLSVWFVPWALTTVDQEGLHHFGDSPKYLLRNRRDFWFLSQTMPRIVLATHPDLNKVGSSSSHYFQWYVFIKPSLEKIPLFMNWT